MTLSGCLSAPAPASPTEEDEASADETPPFYTEGEYTCILFEERDRCWITHVPENLDPEVDVPLIVDMHGYASTSVEQRNLSSFNHIADEEGAIVVYPDGVGYYSELDGQTNQAWNAGWCCAESVTEGVDDVGFIETIVDIAVDLHPIDEQRIYASGWSNGCAMTQRLAMVSSDVFAAAGCMSMYLLTDPVDDYSPIPIIEVHGFLDQVVLYESTLMSVPFNPALWTEPEAYDTGAIENIHEWAEYNNCTGGVEIFETTPLYSTMGFSSCENDAQIRLVTIYAGQHNPYENDLEQDGIGQVFIGTRGLVESTQMVWDFISQYAKEDASSEA
tara:strand:+ start:81 stop:1073 length:993 start_codon:yes stop_codon:yes gene_type:complete